MLLAVLCKRSVSEPLAQTIASYVGDKLVKVASKAQNYRGQNQMGIFGAHGTVGVHLALRGQYTVDHRTIGNQRERSRP